MGLDGPRKSEISRADFQGRKYESGKNISYYALRLALDTYRLVVVGTRCVSFFSVVWKEGVISAWARRTVLYR